MPRDRRETSISTIAETRQSSVLSPNGKGSHRSRRETSISTIAGDSHSSARSRAASSVSTIAGDRRSSALSSTSKSTHGSSREISSATWAECRALVRKLEDGQASGVSASTKGADCSRRDTSLSTVAGDSKSSVHSLSTKGAQHSSGRGSSLSTSVADCQASVRSLTIKDNFHPDFNNEGDLTITCRGPEGKVAFQVNSNILMLSSSTFDTLLKDKPATLRLQELPETVALLLRLMHVGHPRFANKTLKLKLSHVESLNGMLTRYAVSRPIRDLFTRHVESSAPDFPKELGTKPTKEAVFKYLLLGQKLKSAAMWDAAWTTSMRGGGWEIVNSPYGLCTEDRERYPDIAALLLLAAQVIDDSPSRDRPISFSFDPLLGASVRRSRGRIWYLKDWRLY